MARTYLDHAAATPMRPEAIEAMTREFTRVGNASSLHTSGRGARRVVEESREAIAAAVGARPAEVIFTSGGTEAANLAVKGGYAAARRLDPARTEVLTSPTEHHAVLESVEWLARTSNAAVCLLPVDGTGRVNPAELAPRVGPATALVSVAWANNEIGTVSPVRELAELASAAGALSHSDAVQAVGHLPVDFADSGLDLLSFTAHKLGGPVGVGALLARRELALTPVLHGGGQERDVRSGTVPVASVAGFAAAVQTAVAGRTTEEERIWGLRCQLLEAVHAIVPDARLNGPAERGQTRPGVVNLEFPGCDADALLLLLDAAGIDCSAGSACSAGVSQGSHVLLAIGRSERSARSSLRFSLGATSTAADVAALAAALPEVVRRARLAGSLSA